MHRSKGIPAVLLCFTLAACADQGSGPESEVRSDAAPMFSAQGNAVEGSYIVVLNDDANPRSVAAVAGVNPRFVYTAALTGFSAELNAGQLNALRHNPNVAYIEEDGVASTSTTQSGATWGLDRIDQRALPLNTTYNYNNTGAGVRAYIIDTGVNTTLSDFGGRARSGFDAVDGGAAGDCNAHGPHRPPPGKQSVPYFTAASKAVQKPRNGPNENVKQRRSLGFTPVAE